MKGIYHSIEKLLANKKRFRIAAAVFVPLCLAVVGVTLMLSAAPARAESLVSVSYSQPAATPAMTAYNFTSYINSTSWLKRMQQFSYTYRVNNEPGCWPIPGSTNSSPSPKGWTNPSIYTIYWPIFRIEQYNGSSSSATSLGREWAMLCATENAPAPDIGDNQQYEATRNHKPSALAYTLMSADFGRFSFDQFMRFFGLDDDRTVTSTGITIQNVAAANKPGQYGTSGYTSSGVTVPYRDMERLVLMHYVIWFFEYRDKYPGNANLAIPVSDAAVAGNFGISGSRLGDLIMGTTVAGTPNSHVYYIRNSMNFPTYGTTFRRSFQQVVLMINDMLAQYNTGNPAAGKTTSLTMNYDPSTNILTFDHDGFVPYFPSNTKTNQRYYTTIDWDTAATGVTVTVNGTPVARGTRVWKEDVIKITKSTPGNVTMQLTDWQRYLKHNSLRGDTVKNVTHTTYQHLILGYAEFVNLRAEFVISGSVQPTSTILQVNKSTTGDGRPTSWSFNFGLYDSNANGDMLTKIGSDITANNLNPSQAFPSIPISTAGMHHYLVKETSTNGSGWQVSNVAYLVEVDVRDNGAGQLYVYGTRQVRTITNGVWNTTTGVRTGGTWGSWGNYSASSIAFSNAYSPTSITTQLQVNKTTSATGGFSRPASWSFTFGLYASDEYGNQGSKIGSDITANNGSPSPSFPIITYYTSGTYFYLVKETSSSGNGWGVSNVTYYVEVEIKDTNGTLSVDSRWYRTITNGVWNGAGTLTGGTWGSWYSYSASSFTFNNTFTPNNTTTQFGVLKNVSAAAGGSVPANWSFSFTLRSSDFNGSSGTLLETITINQGTAGRTLNFAARTLSTTGYHYFLIEEAAPATGWTPQTQPYLVRVNVRQNAATGHLEVFEKHYKQYNNGWNDPWIQITGSMTNIETAAFDNQYQPGSADTQFGVTKTATAASGAVPSSWSFDFTLYPSDAGGNEAGGAIGTATVNQGTPGFTSAIGGAQALTPGDNYFLIKETPVTGWTAAATAYFIKVNVGTNTTTGDYEVKSKQYQTYSNGSWSGTWLDCPGALASTYNAPFANEFKAPDPTDVELRVNKELAGTGIPAAWSFDFAIYHSDEFIAQDGLIETITIDNSSSFDNVNNRYWKLFAAIPLATAGDHYFLIKETNANTGGWAQTSRLEYHVKVTVAPNSTTGDLEVTAIGWMYKMSGGWPVPPDYAPYNAPDTNIRFINTFTPASTTLQAEKTTSGSGKPSAWEFDIAIFKSDSDGGSLVLLETKQVSDGSPTASFSTGSLNTAGPHYFVIKETSADEDGWKVSAREFLVKFTVGGTSALTVTDTEVFYRDPPETGWTAFPGYPEANITFDNCYEAGYILPEVGGIGTAPFRTGALILSCLLLFLAGAFIYHCLRKRRLSLME